MKIWTLILAFTFSVADSVAPGADTGTEDTSPPRKIADSAQVVEPLKADGETKLPALILADDEGKPFDLNAAVARAPTVLIFYRGNWCPYCTAHLAALQKASKDIADSTYQIVAVSADIPEMLKKSIKKGGLTYTLLSDPRLQAAKAFGLAYRISETDLGRLKKFGIDLSEHSGESDNLWTVPALYLIAQNGTILYSYFDADYTKRLPTADLLKAVEIHGLLSATGKLE